MVASATSELEAFARDGYVVLESVLNGEQARELAARLDALWCAEGPSAGSEFAQLISPEEAGEATSLGDLASRDAAFSLCLTSPRVLAFARDQLGPLVRVHAVNARAPKCGRGQQVLHPHPGLLDTLWLLDEMTATNGPTQVVPGSHRSQADAPTRTITAPAGAVIVLHPLVIHGGTRAIEASPRRIVTVAYSDPGLPPQAAPRR